MIQVPTFNLGLGHSGSKPFNNCLAVSVIPPHCCHINAVKYQAEILTLFIHIIKIFPIIFYAILKAWGIKDFEENILDICAY